MRCETCGEHIVGKPGRVGATRAAGNGFYKGSRPVAFCAPCVENNDLMNAHSAYRETVRNLATIYRNLVVLGQTPEQVESFMRSSGYTPGLIDAVRAEVAS